MANAHCCVFLLFIISITFASSESTWRQLYWQVLNVSAVDDIVLRNYQITATYYQLNIAMCELLGCTESSSTGLQSTWPGIAVWASNSVGVSIRKQLPTILLDVILKDLSFPSWFIEIVKYSSTLADQLFFFILDRTSIAFGGGNLSVFRDIGGGCVRYGLYFSNLTAPDPVVWTAFASTFNITDPVQAQLVKGFNGYYLAQFSTDAKQKAEQIYYGSMLLGAGEQLHLQPYIEAAFPGNVTFHIPAFGTYTWDPAPLVTYLMLTLFLPNELLFAGRDMTPRPWDGRLWDPYLEPFDNETVDAEYISFVGQDVNDNGTAATDWTSLEQRLKFVFPLFRSRQDDLALVNCPVFTAAELAIIWSGQKPDSNGLCFTTCCANSTHVAPLSKVN